jgi:hypothetical protein
VAIWPRLYIDDSQDSAKALKLLLQAGFHPLILMQSPGVAGPELKLGANVCCGLESIREFLALWRKNNPTTSQRKRNRKNRKNRKKR